ncbi:MAG: hypothetical protein M5R41_11455 [Bacteroidia bacterium]|nr:hypothetical protein [Bacteroidia bacterium]MCZ7557004.1 hypothetical protein [Bacteroidia bacterium]
MSQRVSLSDEVDLGVLIALCTNIDSLTQGEQAMAGSVSASPWATDLTDYLQRAVEYLDAYGQLVNAADSARRKRISQLLRKVRDESGLNHEGVVGTDR